MKKRLFYLFLLLGLLGFAFAQETKDKKRLIILPLANQVDTNRFFSSQAENAGLVTFLSIYNFMQNLSFVEVPDKDVLQQIPNENPNLEAIAREQHADFILYGSYQFKGKPANPKDVMSVKIWSAEVKKDVFIKTYKTFTDIDILDPIILDTLSKVFNMNAKFAMVKFDNFKIGKGDKYKLLVNNNQIAAITNQSFSYSLKILAGVPYHFMLVRDRDGNKGLAMKLFVKLKKNETTNFSYTGTASVKIGNIKGKERGNRYQILFDGKQVKEQTVISNIPVNVKHIALLLDKKSAILDQQKLTLLDGETRMVSLGKERGKPLYYRAYALGNSFGGLGVDVFLGNYLWTGLSIGMIYYNDFYVPSATLDISYYLLGDRATSFRLGAGIIGGAYICFPEDKWKNLYGGSNYGFLAGVSSVVEWQFIYLRLSMIHDFSASKEMVSFSPTIGIKF